MDRAETSPEHNKLRGAKQEEEMGYRVLVKLEGMKKYQAVVTEGGEVKV